MIVMVLCCVSVIEFLPADVSQPRAVGQLELSDLLLFAGSMDANVSRQAHVVAVRSPLRQLCEKFCLMMHKVAHMHCNFAFEQPAVMPAACDTRDVLQCGIPLQCGSFIPVEVSQT
jgi:hypothetical protein